MNKLIFEIIDENLIKFLEERDDCVSQEYVSYTAFYIKDILKIEKDHRFDEDLHNDDRFLNSLLTNLNREAMNIQMEDNEMAIALHIKVMCRELINISNYLKNKEGK